MGLTVAVVIPWRVTPDRTAPYEHVTAWYRTHLPDARIIPADSGHAEFNRAASRNAGVRAAGDVDVVVLGDADTIPNPDALLAAITGAAADGLPHVALDKMAHLTATETTRLLTGGTITPRKVLPHDSSCYAIRPAAWWRAGGQDERFTGWGGEDTSFTAACRTLLGPCVPHRGTAWALHHDETVRDFGSARHRPNLHLWRRYRAADENPAAMRTLVNEHTPTRAAANHPGGHDVADVVIDGRRYIPAGQPTHRIGIGVTTHDRPDVFAATYEQITTQSPGCTIVVVDDASTKPVDAADYRFDETAGIARAKNKCLELLMAAGCEHLFLFDDDAYPLATDWWRPYVDSPEPHLMAIYDRDTTSTTRQVEVLYQDATHVAYHATRGYMLYAHRSVVETVGGMDPAFGAWGWEHQSWSDRIHAAGLTTWRYADVTGSDKLIYSMDQHGETTSTVTAEARRFSAGPGLEHRMASRHSPAYIEYRQLDDVVLTCLLTAQDDPQRGKPLPADPKLLKALHDSLTHDGRFVVLHTGLPDAPTALPNAELVQVAQHINPYFERWLAYYQWLRAHPEVGRVWCVDATDVTMTRTPFPEMQPGALYTGYEPTTLRDEWMLRAHPDTTLQRWMRTNPNLPLLNAGLLGGDRNTVTRFAQQITKMWFDDHIDFIYGWEHGRVAAEQAGDMAVFNYTARTHHADRLDTGPHVCNVFKSERPSDTAWFAHK